MLVQVTVLNVFFSKFANKNHLVSFKCKFSLVDLYQFLKQNLKLMNKFAIAVLFTIMISSFAMTLDEAKNMINQDQCASKTLDLIAPEIEAKVAELKKDENNQQAKDELSALIEKSKNIYEKCQGNLKSEPVLRDPIKAAGIAFLLASNCFKDVGAFLLIADTIIQDPKDVTNDIIVSIFLYIMGRQGYADCSQLIHYIH